MTNTTSFHNDRPSSFFMAPQLLKGHHCTSFKRRHHLQITQLLSSIFLTQSDQRLMLHALLTCSSVQTISNSSRNGLHQFNQTTSKQSMKHSTNSKSKMAISNHFVIRIDQFDLYKAISLARSLENHEYLEFRRISSYIYRKQQRWNDAINLSKKDKLYGDCIETASQSRNPEVVEPLLRIFCDEKLFECFAASTYVCCDLVQPDLILELAW